MTEAEERAGQAIYNPLVLMGYDFAVLDVFSPVFWGCPKERVQKLYDDNLGASHVDVGVGTGYFLDKARWPVERPRVALVDLNANALTHTARRIGRFEVTTHRSSAFERFPLADEPPFESGAASYLLHCVPGDLAEKAVVLDNLAACVRPGGRVFGATILSQGVPRTGRARFLMARFNSMGIFHNERDRLEDLRTELDRRFESYDLETSGCMALFAGTVPE